MEIGVLLVFHNMHACHCVFRRNAINIGQMKVKASMIQSECIFWRLLMPEYTIRTFSVAVAGSNDERRVTQYHCTIWPDHGMPEYPTSLLYFVRKVTVSNPLNSGPIVVHCSAGVGRTGVFITLFNQLRRIYSERNLNALDFVCSMRHNRNCMVQIEVSVQEILFSID